MFYTISQVAEGSVPTPSAGNCTLFLNLSGLWKKKDDAGVVSEVTSADLNDKIRITASDTTEGFANVKFLGTSGKITATVINPGANESLVFNVGADIFDKTSDTSDDVTEGTTNLLLTPAERTKISDSITSIVGENHSDLNLDDGTNPHGTTQNDVGLGNVNNTSDVNKPVSTAQQAALDLKYDDSNPDGFETPSQLNSRDTANRNRSNHTGNQAASTISDFDAEVSNNTDVAANTSSRHDAVTVTDSADIDFSLAGQNFSGLLTPTGITAGSYTSVDVTVDAKGRITSISNGGSGSISQSYAEMFFNTNNTTNTTITTQNVPVKISGTTTAGQLAPGWSMPITNRLLWGGVGTLKVVVTMICSINKEQGGGTDNYRGYINVNGSVLNKSKMMTMGNNNNNASLTCSAIIDLPSGQYLEGWMECANDDNTFEANDFRMHVIQILT